MCENEIKECKICHILQHKIPESWICASCQAYIDHPERIQANLAKGLVSMSMIYVTIFLLSKQTGGK